MTDNVRNGRLPQNGTETRTNTELKETKTAETDKIKLNKEELDDEEEYRNNNSTNELADGALIKADDTITINVDNVDKGNGDNELEEEDKKEEIVDLQSNGLAKNGLGSCRAELLALPRLGPRMSCMEEESVKERLRLSLLKQCSAILKQGDEKYTKETLHKAFQDEDLVERIFRLFDVERRDHLVQEDWIEFLKQRLRAEKQIEFVEAIESIAYVLCGNGVISLDNFQLILQSRGITDKLFRLSDADGDGYATADEVMEFLAAVTTSRCTSGFDQHSVEWLEQLFRQTVGDQKEIKRDQFQKILLSKNPFFTERVFQIFDEDDSGAISLQEFIAAVHRFAGQTPDDKIRFMFKVYDLDGDGLIQHRELQHVLRACMEENGMRFSEEQLLELTEAMFEDADLESRGAITYEALKNQLAKHGGLLENLSISIDRWLVPPKPAERPRSARARLARLVPHQLTAPYFRNNYVLVTFLAVFAALNVGLFVSRAVQYSGSNGFVILARACGQCLNFTCAWVLVLMLRQSITYLRTRGFSSVLPLDQHIYLHKLTGVLIFLYSLLHTVMHVCNFSIVVVNDPVVNADKFSVWEWLLTSRPGLFGLVGGCANPTGAALLLVLLVMVVCSQPFIRRGGSFEIFYWSHLLYIVFWLLLIFHAPNFWKWFIVPGVVYIVERVLRLAWMRSERGKTYISSGILLPSRVTHLVIKRPVHFDFRPGDYVFVNIPAIATYEWHPFTVSSAPEQEEYLWLHVRGVGQWTNRLYECFEREQRRLHAPPAAPTSAPASASVTAPVTAPGTGHTVLDRSLSNSSSGGKKRSVDFSPASYCNEAFTIDEETDVINQTLPSSPEAREKQTGLLLVPLKMPLEKSLSMPDMQNKVKKKERLNALRSYARSESEANLEEGQAGRRARLGLSLRPQRCHVARSFRYMRSKPTIIAFKTPSFEKADDGESIITVARRRLSKSLSPDKDVETPKTKSELDQETTDEKTFANYPIGKPLEIYLEGPYGAPSSHMFRAQHAVLIATGIGVTPFASILQSIMMQYWKARHTCPRCNHCWATDMPEAMRLRKVDFFWINREQRSFEWFVSLLSQLEIEQAELGGALERFLDMHMYITSALQRTDMKAVGLQLALDLLHEKEKRDLITGLKTRTIAGRPNWDKVFKQLQEQKKGKVTVFYCGPPQLAKVLRLKCDQFGFSFRKEVF